MRKSDTYWERRARQRMAGYHRRADHVMAQIASAYDKGQQDIAASIDRIFGKFAKDGKLTTEEAQKLLSEPISRSEWETIRSQYGTVKDPAIRRQLLNRLNAPAYAARITRLQALQADVYVQSKRIADAEITASTAGYIRTINDAYYRTMFDIQQGTGYAFDFAAMPAKTVEAILKRPWSGEHFSRRIWSNTDVLAKQVSDTIIAGIKSGASTKRMRDDLAERMNVGKHAANRLIRTETTYMANAAEMESYEEADIDHYRFVATLDLRTSPQCRAHDLKVYEVKNAKPGDNLPPLHPYCRSTTIAVIDVEEDEELQRRARDPVTGETKTVPASMSYDEWKDGLDREHGLDRVAEVERNLQNEAADKEQYAQYKAILGERAPKSFAAFRELKYTGGEGWGKLKGDYRKLNAYDKIVANEPRITADLKAISADTGVDMIGLDYRLKTKASYLRKVNSDSKNSTDAKIISDTISGTNDVIRYTYQADSDKLVDAFKSVSESMEAKGYTRFKLKNTWNDKRNPYKGINGIFVAPNGQRFEVQFHTPESFELKDGPLHKLYEEYRLDGTSPERRAELTKEMFTLSAGLERPKDIDSIK